MPRRRSSTSTSEDQDIPHQQEAAALSTDGDKEMEEDKAPERHIDGKELYVAC